MSGFAAANIKVLLACVEAGAVLVMGPAAACAVVVVLVLTPNCKVFCVAGASTEGELAPVDAGVDRFPKRDLRAGCGVI